jgi:hypothetical protein
MPEVTMTEQIAITSPKMIRPALRRTQAASCVWIGAEHQEVDGHAKMAVVGPAHAALLPLVAEVTSQISTPSHRKTIGPLPLGLGPDRVRCSVSSVQVSPTRQTPPRNGITTLPDTAISRLKARGQFLTHEETGDAPTAPDFH